jgi:hypothetical protein
MRVFGVWRGGDDLSADDVFEQMETWPSLRAAKLALRLRADSGGYPVDDQAHAVRFEDEGRATVGEARGFIAYHGVDAAKTDIHLYAARKDGDGWAVAVDYPSARLCLGPRGGVQVESI